MSGQVRRHRCPRCKQRMRHLGREQQPNGHHATRFECTTEDCPTGEVLRG